MRGILFLLIIILFLSGCTSEKSVNKFVCSDGSVKDSIQDCLPTAKSECQDKILDENGYKVPYLKTYGCIPFTGNYRPCYQRNSNPDPGNYRITDINGNQFYILKPDWRIDLSNAECAKKIGFEIGRILIDEKGSYYQCK